MIDLPVNGQSVCSLSSSSSLLIRRKKFFLFNILEARAKFKYCRIFFMGCLLLLAVLCAIPVFLSNYEKNVPESAGQFPVELSGLMCITTSK
jgi:hypothetical protein